MRLVAPLTVLLALVLVPAVPATPPPKAKAAPGLIIEGETAVVVRRVPFDVVAPAGGKLYFWRLPAGWKADAPLVAARITVTEAPAGMGTVAVDAVSADFTVASYSLAVSIGAVVPPGPSPAPLPPIAKAWVVVIEETAEAAAGRGAYLADRPLGDYVRAKGWKVRLADKDVRDASGQPPRDLAPYLAQAAGKALPLYWVVDAAGTVRGHGPLPATPAAFLATLRAIGGE